MFDRAQNKGEQNLRYYIKHWNLKGSFYILNDISKHVTLVQFVDTI